MADQETRREEESVESSTSPQQGRVTIARVPDQADVPASQRHEATPSTENLQTRTMAQIEPEHLHSPDHVVQLDSVPPIDEADEPPFAMQEMREAAGSSKATAEIREERKLGPFTASMWFLVLSIITFVVALFMWLLQ
jgi:cobalamin biosynthesis Mg chelatase CobN